MISNSSYNVIGQAGASNVISGNIVNGIEITGAGSFQNTIQGNTIGLDLNGLLAVPNGLNGILLDANPLVPGGASTNTIGGTGAGMEDLIGGNGLDGIQISSGSSSNQVLGNIIGLIWSAKTPQGNSRHGVSIFDSTTT